MRVLQAPLCRRAWSSLLGQRGRGMGAPALGSGGRVLPRPLACGEEVEPEGTVPRQGLSGLRGSKDEVCNGGTALSSLTRLCSASRPAFPTGGARGLCRRGNHAPARPPSRCLQPSGGEAEPAALHADLQAVG